MNDRALRDEHLEYLKKICFDAGMKLTHQRIEVFHEMMQSSGHPSADAIYERLKKRNPTIAIDTVYRALATFESLGVIKKLQVMGERALFDTNLDQHHHFVCTRCKRVQDIYWPEFDKTPPPEGARRVGSITSRHLEIRGICNECIDTDARE